MIQHSVFHDGSFVLHKVMVNGTKYSAWYHANGSLKDCEMFDKNGRNKNVPSGYKHVLSQLDKIGKRYVGKADK